MSTSGSRAITEKYFSRAISAQVTFGKGPYDTASPATSSPTCPRAWCSRARPAQRWRPAAFDQAADRIEKQLRRYKRRLKDRHAQSRACRGSPTRRSRLHRVRAAARGRGAGRRSAGHRRDPGRHSRSRRVSDAVMLLDLRNTNALLFRNSGTGGTIWSTAAATARSAGSSPQRGWRLAPPSLYPSSSTEAARSHPVHAMSDLSDILIDRGGRRRSRRRQQEGAVPAARRRGGAADRRRRPRRSSPRLNEREKLGSTGFGGGVAIPHGKIEGLDRRGRLFRAAGDAGRLRGGRRPAGRSRLPAALAARRGRRPSEGAGRGQPGVARPPDRRQAARRALARTRSTPCSPARTAMPPEAGAGAQRRISARSKRSTARRRSTAVRIRDRDRRAGPRADPLRGRRRPLTTPPAPRTARSISRCSTTPPSMPATRMVSDRFLLTTAFNLLFTKPIRAGGRRRGALDQRPAPGVRRRSAADHARRRGGGARHRHLHALAHRARPASPAIAPA